MHQLQYQCHAFPSRTNLLRLEVYYEEVKFEVKIEKLSYGVSVYTAF